MKWWIFTFIHNCVWIVLFITRNAKKFKKSQNEFQWTTKHFFGNFEGPALEAKHFEFIEYIFFVKWFKKWFFCLVAFSFKISRLWNFCMIWFFIKFIQWTCTFIERNMFLLYTNFEINCITLCIPFDSFLKKCSIDTWYS